MGGVVALACLPVQEARAGAFSAENSQTSARTLGRRDSILRRPANRQCVGQLFDRCRFVFLFRLIAGLKAPTAAKPDSSREVIRENKVNRAPLS